jgi:hypothetical protein
MKKLLGLQGAALGFGVAFLAALGAFFAGVAFVFDFPSGFATRGFRAPEVAFFRGVAGALEAASLVSVISSFMFVFSFRGSRRDQHMDHSGGEQKQVNCAGNLRAGQTCGRNPESPPWLFLLGSLFKCWNRRSGSGTTLAAAELTERVCCGSELDPKYVDVVVLRWQALSGQQATLEGDGRTFAEIKAERPT